MPSSVTVNRSQRTTAARAARRTRPEPAGPGVGNGILSGKYTRPGGLEPGTATRLSAEAIGDRELAEAEADELGASCAQVAIAWTMAHSPAVHPILGARRVEQFMENLGAAELTLPTEVLAALETATDRAGTG